MDFNEPAPEVNLVTRAEWGAKETNVKQYTNRDLPLAVIYFSVKSGVPDCNGKEECSKVMLDFQKKSMETLPDIPYNFVIAKDGTIFEGRGWGVKPHRAIQSEPVDMDPRAYDIAFFGEYPEGVEVPHKAFVASMDLLTIGIRKRHVIDNYSMEPIHTDDWKPMRYPGKEFFSKIKPIKDGTKANPRKIKTPIKPQKEEPMEEEWSFSDFFSF